MKTSILLSLLSSWFLLFHICGFVICFIFKMSPYNDIKYKYLWGLWYIKNSGRAWQGHWRMMRGRKYGRASLLLAHWAAICLTYTQKDKNICKYKNTETHWYKYQQKQRARSPLVYWAICLTYTQDCRLAIWTIEIKYDLTPKKYLTREDELWPWTDSHSKAKTQSCKFLIQTLQIAIFSN